ncbi:MAG: helix-turn-helix domain-containing protein [Deltaproteobacteria bacterium]|jgi:DNA-binding transcriptional MerR regulator|nr:helix-turn-helix domain-containing protein [Deltaproteobacteria bacterium]
MTEDLVTSIDERMWTEKEAAYLLHISPNTLWLWRKQKKITFFRLANGTIRYRKSDLEMFLRAGACLADKGREDGNDN